jgi:hypothetical protein
MSFETTRTSRSAIVAEVTEGTPVSPSAGTDFVALQDGFSMNPNFESLENAELSGTSGMSAPVQGVESPEASISHYLRGSGTEGVAPNYSLYMESLFGSSSKSTNSTERLTAAACTTSLIKLASGGSDFAAGKAILLKDSTNGYVVRNVTSVATNDLSIAFNVASAPAAGLGCGKCINFVPTEVNKSFSLWNYLANGGAVQMMAGSKTSSATFNFPAGQPINADYSFIGTSYYFNPLEIKATSKYIDFKINGGSEITATLTEKIYRDPAELAAEVQSKMDAATTATITCSYSSTTGKFTIVASGATSLDILWLTGTNNANNAKTVLGYSAADDTGALTYTSDSALSFASGYTPSLDSEPFLVAKANELMVGSATDYACLAADSVTVNYSKESNPVNSICETSGKASDIFNSRSITVDIVAYLQKYDISKWLSFKNNDTVQFAYNAGRKSNSQWVAGSVVNLFSPTAKISTINFSDLNGIVAMNLTLTCFCSNAQPEFYINYL